MLSFLLCTGVFGVFSSVRCYTFVQSPVYQCRLATILLFAGEFFNAPLGNVYAEDEDDWDVENKTFAFVDSEPERFFRYTSRSFFADTEADVGQKIILNFSDYLIIKFD